MLQLGFALLLLGRLGLALNGCCIRVRRCCGLLLARPRLGCLSASVSACLRLAGTVEGIEP